MGIGGSGRSRGPRTAQWIHLPSGGAAQPLRLHLHYKRPHLQATSLVPSCRRVFSRQMAWRPARVTAVHPKPALDPRRTGSAHPDVSRETCPLALQVGRSIRRPSALPRFLGVRASHGRPLAGRRCRTTLLCPGVVFHEKHFLVVDPGRRSCGTAGGPEPSAGKARCFT
jgi:hypothetical protein